jgi:hypothetical protein
MKTLFSSSSSLLSQKAAIAVTLVLLLAVLQVSADPGDETTTVEAATADAQPATDEPSAPIQPSDDTVQGNEERRSLSTTTTPTVKNEATKDAKGRSLLSTSDDASNSSAAIDAKMVKMEKLRSQMFNPTPAAGADSADKNNNRVLRRSSSLSDISPAQQVASLKEGSREQMQKRLTELFESTKSAQLARKRAKSEEAKNVQGNM